VDPTCASPPAETGWMARPAPADGGSANALRADNNMTKSRANAARMVTSEF
jgi:hypothetical protein